MNKSELIEAMASKSETSKSEAERLLNAFIHVVTDSVKSGKKVAISGLGSFEKVSRAARVGINPQTGTKIQIKAKGAPKFKASKVFKDLVA